MANEVQTTVPAACLDALRRRIDVRLNNHLVDMRADYDNSITGFNTAWDIVRAALKEASEALQP